MAGFSKPVRSLIDEINKMVDSGTAGLKKGKYPKPTRGGLRGSYYLSDASGNCVAVFKPLDEEPKAVDYAREGIKEETLGPAVALTPEGLRKGTKAGKGGFREAAAYRLDHPISDRRCKTFGFAGVPPTTFVSCCSVYFKSPEGAFTDKLGSLQMYMENEGDCGEAKIDSDVYNEFPLHEVHKIAVLDIRFANADRHGGNILRSKSSPVVLIPIDHGYCFPKSFGGGRFVWLAWPQAKKPFSEKTIKYIETLDAEKDICLLESCRWHMTLPVARVFRISAMLLKKGAKKNLTPHAIGEIMCRSKNEECEIEKIFNKASKEDDDKFIKVVSDEIDSLLDRIAK